MKLSAVQFDPSIECNLGLWSISVYVLSKPIKLYRNLFKPRGGFFFDEQKSNVFLASVISRAVLLSLVNII